MIIQPAKRLQNTSEYYFSKKLKEVRSLIASGKNILNLAIGSPDLSPSNDTIQALSKSASEPGNHGYQPYQGLDSLRLSISEYLQKTYNTAFDPSSEILPLMGSKEGITHISLAFLDEKDLVLVPELGYPSYASVSKMLGAKVVYYPLDDHYYPDWDALKQMDIDGAKIMWLNYPHMPSGAPANIEVFQNAVAFGLNHQVLICHDNPYSLVLNENTLSIFQFKDAKEVCLELNSLSKSHNMAGWRVGWVSGAADYIRQVLTIKSNVDSGMFKGIQEAAIEALKNDEHWHHERNQIYAERKKIGLKIMERLNVEASQPQTGMFIWGKLPANVSGAYEASDHLLNHYHIFMAPGTIFGKRGEKFIRLSLCSHQEILNEALNRLNDFSWK